MQLAAEAATDRSNGAARETWRREDYRNKKKHDVCYMG